MAGHNNGGKWQFWIDRGGTFTDVVARTPEGKVLARKLLSEHPSVYSDAALEGIRQFLGVPTNAPIPSERIASVKMGTTVATNALLERKGDATLLVITHGLKDQLEIGTQARPDIFAKKIVKPEMLYSRVVEAIERVRADGTVETPLDLTSLETQLKEARADGIDAVAIVFMHAYAYPEHERQAAALARELGFGQVSASHAVSPLIKIVARGDTSVADAYLSPILRRYVERVSSAFDHENTRVLFMASSGGLKSAEMFRGRDAILSGPAGGVVGMAETAQHAGFDKVIGFDMGGTSTDVSHFAGEYERTFETQVAGVRLTVPMLRIHTVAAGGGSILTYDGARFRVGPQSAGASPGPKCYRAGGPLTVTDANLMVGKLDPAFFPKIFGPGRDEPLDSDGVRAGFAELAQQVGNGRSPEEVADGFIRIAVENMANAIKNISLERGYDVTEYALNCFGSAGGQHACLIADTLGIEAVLIHPLSGLLSAYGMGLAHIRASRERSIEVPLNADTMRKIENLAFDLGSETTEELLDEGVEHDDIAIQTFVHLRYEGADTALPIPFSEPDIMARDFEMLHRQRFGFISPEKSIFAAAIEVEAAGGGEVAEVARPGTTLENVSETASAQVYDTTRFYSSGAWRDAPVYLRKQINPGMKLMGPALLIESNQTVVIEDGWQLEVSPRNDLVLRRSVPRPRERLGTEADPVLLEVFNNLFMSIAEQMGEALRNTAQSVNIKERLDFSCAIFDTEGHLVANAPHLPVHLGSMDRSVETIIRLRRSEMRSGDVYMLNAPYNGGTHLPDITVVTPVFDEQGTEILFYVASRGHHADVGGITPGSMTPHATTIEEEGVYIDNVKLVDQGRFLEDETRALLQGAKHPARQPDKNIADLKAQVAASAKGEAELHNMVAHFGLDVVKAYMQHIQNNAEASVRRLLARLSDGHFRVEMDQGTCVEVRISVDRETRTARVDFTGTSQQQANNFNAPEPVTRAAVLYTFRVMVDEPIPMNAGCLKPIEIIIPDGSMLSPTYPAAVVAGNVETSQIVTNALFAALGALGSTQGTMNNLTFGNEQVQYYETLCSGAPAGPGFSGAAGVHVHMTNTRLTDPEILELRYPVLLEEFSIRRGSGGVGKWNSGDGTRRVIRFLERMDCAILSSSREVPPFGLDGGAPGETGNNLLRRKNGSQEQLKGCDQTVLEPGEAIIIVTPTGGGFGHA
ncbi:MAG: 5-oxoprolinase [Hyphomicrobium sp.]|nr:5-oxoprolinase [Hyphomicrobium sp.]